jgi:glutamine amidotransferase
VRNICIIDYGMGNLTSVASALAMLGHRATVTIEPESIASAKGLVLPGVGAFPEAMRRLEQAHLIDTLERRVLRDGVPILGICLGMQLFATSSTEHGLHRGLGWIAAEVDRIADSKVRIPHIGWSEVIWTPGAMLARNISPDANFYFNHSFCMTCHEDIVASRTGENGAIVAALAKGNLFGTQFHPEKSQTSGLRLLRNFLNYVEAAAAG